jgi:hypothetical protein
MCATGKLTVPECEPVWQLGIIGVFLISAIALLIVLKMRAYATSAQPE